MYEKISDKSIREDKVRRLKERSLTEIANELDIIKEEMKEYPLNDEAFDFLVKRSFVLLKLKEYIQEKDTFQSCITECPNEDVVIYTVSSKNLDIWLQDDYSLVYQFLCMAEEYKYNVSLLLNDHYFGYNFTNIFDIILYDKRMEEQKELNTKY